MLANELLQPNSESQSSLEIVKVNGKRSLETSSFDEKLSNKRNKKEKYFEHNVFVHDSNEVNFHLMYSFIFEKICFN
jgi:hypothetical protein